VIRRKLRELREFALDMSVAKLTRSGICPHEFLSLLPSALAPLRFAPLRENSRARSALEFEKVRRASREIACRRAKFIRPVFPRSPDVNDGVSSSRSNKGEKKVSDTLPELDCAINYRGTAERHERNLASGITSARRGGTPFRVPFPFLLFLPSFLPFRKLHRRQQPNVVGELCARASVSRAR